MKTSIEPYFSLKQRVLVARADSPTCDPHYIGKTGTVTAVEQPDENDLSWRYQVTLADGRHDLFYSEELERA